MVQSFSYIIIQVHMWNFNMKFHLRYLELNGNVQQVLHFFLQPVQSNKWEQEINKCKIDTDMNFIKQSNVHMSRLCTSCDKILSELPVKSAFPTPTMMMDRGKWDAYNKMKVLQKLKKKAAIVTWYILWYFMHRLKCSLTLTMASMVFLVSVISPSVRISSTK